MTHAVSNKKINISATEQALADASMLLSRLCKSRKAGIKVKEIKELTLAVSSLNRSLLKQVAEEEKADGYGDKEYCAKMAAMGQKNSGLIR